MFWTGWIIALIAALLSIGLSREAVKSRYPVIRDYQLDWLMLLLVVVGFVISAVVHVSSERQFAELQQRSNELKRLNEPRRLTKIQRAKIISILSNKPKGELEIKASVGVPDAKDYADQMAEAFRAGGWKVSVFVATFSGFGNDTSGIFRVVRKPVHREELTTIYEALNEAAVPIRSDIYRDAKGPPIWLGVGVNR